MPNIIPFTFQAHDVRVVEIDGQPWFVGADVCAVLDHGNHRQALARVDEDDKGVHILDTPGGRQNLTVINESGLYALVLTSRKAEAKRFKKWVTSEVLPSIRRTGSYGSDPLAALEDPAKVRHLLLHHVEARLAAEARVAELEPEANAYQRLAVSDGSLCVTNAAKALQIQPKVLFAWLSQNKWMYRRAGGGSWVAYQDRIQSGHLEHKVTEVTRQDGSGKISEQVRVTPKGLAKLAKVFAVPVGEAA